MFGEFHSEVHGNKGALEWPAQEHMRDYIIYWRKGRYGQFLLPN
jgi:hypothetical protein